MSHARLGAAVLWVAWLNLSAATQAQPPTDEIVARHVRQLKDADAHLRVAAAIRLGELGDRAAAAVPALAEALSDPDESVRRYAASALGELGRHAKSAIAALGRLEADPSRYTRETAWKSLVQIEPGIALDTASLAAGLKSTQAMRRRWSAEALALLKGGGARPALAELIVALGDESA
ncbi:MAG TPA: HEAT repeat domain-containing protein, partial [Pirellulales bacterium]